MTHHFPIAPFISALLLGASFAASATITVTQPPAGETRITQGQDYAIEQIGNLWDMDGSSDVVLSESRNLVNESFSNEIYSLETTSNDNLFWMVWPGLLNAFRGLETGERFPIDTVSYRYLTVKVRMSELDGSPLSANQPFIVRFFEDANRSNPGALIPPPGNTYEHWTVISWDLHDPDSFFPDLPEWLDFPQVRGLRFNPTNNANVRVEIDWIRLTVAPVAGTSGTVAWDDNSGSGPYDVFLSDGEFDWQVVDSTSDTSVQVDLSQLPAGDYTVIVTDGNTVGTSPGAFVVNDTPLLNLTVPDRKGDQARAYGIVETGNDWASIDAGDIAATEELANVRFDDPLGALTARPTGSDPRIRFDTTSEIDTSLYRMLCYTLEVKGPRDIGIGSVARVFWGNSLPSLATSQDIVVNEGLNEYCVGDLTDMPTEDPADDWSGEVEFIRIDPHEFPVSSQCTSNPSPEACRDIRLDSFILAPFHRSTGAIVLQWDASDSDDDGVISLFYDPDRNPDNGNEGLIVENLGRQASGGSFSWDTSTVPAGVYNILSVIDDDCNATLRYSTGPVEVINDVVFADGFETP